jgi:hypothetical protein
METILSLSLATAAISVTIARGKIFAPAREYVASLSTWLGDLFSCPYCVSHYVAMGAVFIYRPVVVVSSMYVVDLIASAFVVVALSALVAGAIISLLFDRQRLEDLQSQNDALKAQVELLSTALKSARTKIVSMEREK